MISDEEAKAIQEVAKSARDLVPALRDFGKFVGLIIGGPLEQASIIVKNELEYMCLQRQCRLMQKTRQLMAEIGMDGVTRSLPVNVAVPLLQAASLEEDDELQDMWACMIINGINANSEVEIKRSLVSILQDFGPLEAQILNDLVNAPKNPGPGFLYTVNIPDKYIVTVKIEAGIVRQIREAAKLAIWNLIRLGCISQSISDFEGLNIWQVTPTTLGETMVRACTVKEKRI